jgi:alpha-beta hydrolase superfamily lysophospholipase
MRRKRNAILLLAFLCSILFATSSHAEDFDATWNDGIALLNSDSPGAFWLPPKSVPLKGIVVCLHGFGLNAASYDSFGQAMSAKGYALFAPDVRGFGYWRESGLHPKLDLSAAVEDVRKITRTLKASHPELPLFILGESMGGAIGLAAVAMYPHGVDGLIAAVPSSARFEQKKASAKVAVRYLIDPDKEFDVKNKVIDRAVSSDELKQLWLSDQRNRLHVSPRELVHFQRFMNSAMDLAKNITETPVLLVQGCRDNLVKPTATIKLYNSLRSTDKRLLMVGNAEHLIFQKGQFNEQTIEMLTGWMGEASKAGQSSELACQ